MVDIYCNFIIAFTSKKTSYGELLDTKFFPTVMADSSFVEIPMKINPYERTQTH